MFQSTLEAFAVLLVVGVIGFLAVTRGLVPRNALAPISRIALEIALPALVFTNLVTQEFPAGKLSIWQLPLWWMAFTATTTMLAFALAMLAPTHIRNEFRAALVYPNAVFVPLLLLSARFGQTSTQVAMLFIFTVAFSPVYFSTYPLLFGLHGIANIRWQRILHPVLIMTLIAMALRSLGLQNAVPESLIGATTMLGAAALPLILLVLGGQLTINARQTQSNHIKAVIAFVFIKNLLFPALFLGLLILVRPPRLIALFILIQAAMPPITSLPIIAQRADADHATTTRFLIASFLAAVVTVPLAIAAFDAIFN